MHGHEYPPCSANLKKIRTARGLTSQELAAQIGLPQPWVEDLEAYNEEMYCNVSLGDLQRLSLVLGVPMARLLLADQTKAEGDRIHFADIPQRLRSVLAARGESPESFGNRIGWEVDRALEQADDCWGWCADELKEIGTELGINWVAALPGPLDAPPPHAAPGA